MDFTPIIAPSLSQLWLLSDWPVINAAIEYINPTAWHNLRLIRTGAVFESLSLFTQSQTDKQMDRQTDTEHQVLLLSQLSL